MIHSMAMSTLTTNKFFVRQSKPDMYISPPDGISEYPEQRPPRF